MYFHIAPRGDPTSDEPESETWSPAQTVESVLISIISLLDDPNGNSPANIDASVEFRKNYNVYKKKVLQEVERSKRIFQRISLCLKLRQRLFKL